MKRLLLLMLFALPALGQQSNIFRDLETNGGTSIVDKAYVTATNDTTFTFDLWKHSNVFVTVQSKDSASIHIKCQYSADGRTFDAIVTLDSLSTNSNTGDVKSLNLTTGALGAAYMRLILDPTAFLRGTSTATYSAYLTKKN